MLVLKSKIHSTHEYFVTTLMVDELWGKMIDQCYSKWANFLSTFESSYICTLNFYII